MTDVFISYSRKDKVFARRLFERLEQEKLEGWADWEGITGGEDWWRRICASIDAAKTVVIIISTDALASQYCNLEIERARQNNKRIIPILRREPDAKFLAGEWFGKEWETSARENYDELQARQYVLFRKKPGYECVYDETTHEISNPECYGPQTAADDFELAFQTLLKDVRKDPEYLNDHTHLLLRAQEWQARRGGLLRGDELTSAEAWLAGSESKDPRPTDLQRRYITASRKADRRRRTAFLGAVSTALIVLSLLTVISLVLTRIAGNRSLLAERAQATAEQRARELRSFGLVISARERYNAGDPFTALPLALAANADSNPSLLAKLTLADIAYGSRARMRFFERSAVNSVAFSPDGQMVLSGSDGGTLLLWDAATGDTICSIQGYDSPVTDESFTLDGTSFVSIGQDDKSIASIVWDTSTCTKILGSEAAIDGKNILAVSADGQMTLSPSNDYSLRLSDLATDNLIQRFEGHTDHAAIGVFSPDGNTLASGAPNGELLLWDVATGDLVHRLEGHANRVTSLAFKPEGNMLASGSSDGKLLLWDVRRYRFSYSLKGHSTSITSVAFSPDGTSLVSGSTDQTVVLWDVEINESPQVFAGHNYSVSSVVFSPDGETVLSGSVGRTLRLWDIDTGRELYRRELYKVPGSATSVAFSPNGRMVVTGSCGGLSSDHRICFQGSLEVRSAEDGTLIRTLIGGDLSTGMVRSVAFSPAGNTLLSGGGCGGRPREWCGRGEIIEWDLESGQVLDKFYGQTGRVESIVYSSDGKMALSGGCARGRDHLDNPFQEFCELGEMVLWDLESGEILDFFHVPGARVWSVAFGPNDWTVLSGSEDGILRMWDVASGQLVRTFQSVGGRVNSIAFSPDGSMILAGMEGRIATLWNVANGQLLRTFHTGSPITSGTFSPDEKSIIAGSGNKLILWDIDLSAEQLTQLISQS